MTLTQGAAAAAALLASTGCSLLCSTSNLDQACDQDGDCLPGYTCDTATSKCEKATNLDAGPSGCAVPSQDTDCPAGTCSNGLCDDQLIAWSNGASNTVDNGCFASFPPGPSSDAGVLAELAGCLFTLPNDAFSSEPSLFLNVDAGQALVSAAASCGPGNYSYIFPSPVAYSDGGTGPGITVPIGQLFELDTFTDAGKTPIRTYPVYIPPSQSGGAQRNAFSISPARQATLLGQMGVTLDGGGTLGGGTLILGVVNDCSTADLSSGTQLSGVQIVVQQLRQPVFYLDVNGVPVAGREATDPSGLFASYLAPGSPSLISISYFQTAGDGGEIGFGPESSVVALDVTGPGVIWVPLSPAGP